MLRKIFISQIEKLNFDPTKPIVVAMSGGVDSSFIAALLSLMQYKVIGITLKLYESNKTVKSKACCSGRDIEDARIVAESFKFKHYTLNYVSKFKESVIDQFIYSYMRGETPIPCITCNKEVKFKDLLHTAKSLGAQCLITGHYIMKQNNKLYRAIDQDKDQSYFLFNIDQEELDFLEFPLGYFTKQQVRDCATEIGLHINMKPDSQDICFVQNNNYRDLLPKGQKGFIKDKNGKIFGEHEGIANFTVGQKKGLKINFHHPLYVIDFDNHDVIIGEYNDLLCSSILLRDINLLGDENDVTEVKVRYGQKPINAKLKDQYIYFDTPIVRPAAGQACVFYNQEHLLGGGWICNNNYIVTT